MLTHHTNFFNARLYFSNYNEKLEVRNWIRIHQMVLIDCGLVDLPNQALSQSLHPAILMVLVRGSFTFVFILSVFCFFFCFILLSLPFTVNLNQASLLFLEQNNAATLAFPLFASVFETAVHGHFGSSPLKQFMKERAVLTLPCLLMIFLNWQGKLNYFPFKSLFYSFIYFFYIPPSHFQLSIVHLSWHPCPIALVNTTSCFHLMFNILLDLCRSI